MESVHILRRCFIVVLWVAVSLSACRARQDETEEISPTDSEPAPRPPRTPQLQTAPSPPPSKVVDKPAEPVPTAPPVAPEPAREVAPPFPMPSPPAPPPVPEIIEVTLPEGTVLELELLTPLDTAVSLVGDEIQARTLSLVYLKGEPVLPRGTYVEGRVTEVTASGRVKGRALLAFCFDRLSTRSGLKEIRTSYVREQAQSQTKKDAGVIGGAAGIGALMGGIIGGKKGAAIGATIGGAGGTGVVLATKGEEIRLPVGTEVNVRLDEPVVLQLN